MLLLILYQNSKEKIALANTKRVYLRLRWGGLWWMVPKRENNTHNIARTESVRAALVWVSVRTFLPERPQLYEFCD